MADTEKSGATNWICRTGKIVAERLRATSVRTIIIFVYHQAGHAQILDISMELFRDNDEQGDIVGYADTAMYHG
ncbi:hypothetical protein [Sideroxyarcus emersonii]|uniref:hypothetical protein n=1 Tax=Sideroxyarcus emersonii TaxID=2764705 RepID=UPI001F1B88DF|nr:hypothetical protein [Sideroxyarcus emersonii]